VQDKILEQFFILESTSSLIPNVHGYRILALWWSLKAISSCVAMHMIWMVYFFGISPSM